MFTIQYQSIDGESRMQDFDSKNRTKLIIHLATFTRPILAVYEQAVPITKAVRNDLAQWAGSKSRYAVDFVNSRP